ncbi:MAG: uridylate kinase [Archaeoglobales archaeon]|nr:uridylate kinase [Archaeoglobales archaeon]
MILKVGGSVAGRLDEIVESIKNKKVLVIPGGWKFADLVRGVYKKFGISEDAAHWMAVAAMDQYGYFIAEKGIKILEVDSFEDLTVEDSRVLLPYKLLKKYDELPHSWDVTSDTISAWIASKIGEKMVLKVTAVKGIFLDGKLIEKIKASELKAIKSDVVDRYLPEFLIKSNVDFFICSVDELKKYILSGKAEGTLIEGR